MTNLIIGVYFIGFFAGMLLMALFAASAKDSMKQTIISILMEQKSRASYVCHSQLTELIRVVEEL